MITLKISSNLLGKTEMFKIIALGHAIKKPILFIGQPGVAKTQVMREYAQAVQDYYNNVNAGEKSPYKHFILEANDDSRPSEITGRIDLEQLVLNKKYVLHSDIEGARAVMINEVDKGTSAFRNAMLSAMNEKVLFRGNEEVQLPWEIFVGTCNSIPEDEVKSHFFDRFIIKYNVSRLSIAQINSLFDKYDYDKTKTVDEIVLNIPDRADLDKITISSDKMNKFLNAVYSHLSDRTLTYSYDIVKAIMYIWKISQDKALIKAAELLVNKSASNLLAQSLYSPEMKSIMNDIEILEMSKDDKDLTSLIKTVTDKISISLSNGSIDHSQAQTLIDVLGEVFEDLDVTSLKLNGDVNLKSQDTPLDTSKDSSNTIFQSTSTTGTITVDPFS
jgi:MoxR-like ATPase